MKTFDIPPCRKVGQIKNAIKEAILALNTLSIRGRISIHSDSRSAVERLSGDHFRDKLSYMTAREIQSLAKTTWLRLQWVKAHVGTEGNERADELAKMGTKCVVPQALSQSQRAAKTKYKETTDEQWMTEWATCKGHDRSKTWFPRADRKRTEQLLTFGRAKLGVLLQWFTGFCNLMRHRHVKDNSISPWCRLCGEAWETPEHLSFFCPRLTKSRADFIGTWEGWPEKWKPGQIFDHIANTGIMQMMEDNTDYNH